MHRLAAASVALATAAALVGCGPKTEAEDAVKQLLNDPDSARFSTVEAVKDGNVCGMVNAKNRMGGYVGQTPFFYVASSKYVAIVSPPEESDFRSLWLSIRTQSATASDYERLATKCQLVTQLNAICGTSISSPPLCGAISQNGVVLYRALEAAYDH